MEGVRKIHDIENEMIGQIRQLYETAFPPIFGYTVEYFLGEEEGTQRGVLVYSVTSKVLGNIYRKQMRLPDHVVREEIEPDFLGKVITDFIMLGTSFITNNIMVAKASKANDVDGILVKPFSEGRLKNINPN
jgi:hypothetical protein